MHAAAAAATANAEDDDTTPVLPHINPANHPTTACLPRMVSMFGRRRHGKETNRAVGLSRPSVPEPNRPVKAAAEAVEAGARATRGV